MSNIPHLRPILWIGSSLKDLRGMPEEVKKEFGHSLREIQKGRDQVIANLFGIWENQAFQRSS